MFDSLREKLGKFREDVDESVDEAPGDAEETGDQPEDDSASIGEKARTLVGERAFIIDEDSLEKPLSDLEMALLSSDVELSVAEEIIDGLRQELTGQRKHWRESKADLIEDALKEAMIDVLETGSPGFRERIEEAESPVVVIFTGVNGVGKTTTIAKIATRLEEWGYSSVLANGDTFRAGANEQIEEHAANIDKRLISHEKGGDPTAVIYDAVEYAEANNVDVVLGDTAGRLHTSDDLMNQLRKIQRVVDPDFVVYVDESIAGQDVVRRAQEFDDAAEIDGFVLTKADADANGGAALSLTRVTGKPIYFLGTGQGYSDLEEFNAEGIVKSLIG